MLLNCDLYRYTQQHKSTSWKHLASLSKHIYLLKRWPKIFRWLHTTYIHDTCTVYTCCDTCNYFLIFFYFFGHVCNSTHDIFWYILVLYVYLQYIHNIHSYMYTCTAGVGEYTNAYLRYMMYKLLRINILQSYKSMQ